MKIKTNFFIYLVLIVIFALGGAKHSALAQSGNWTDAGNFSTSWPSGSGSGTEASPYAIYTAAELAKFAKMVNDGTEDFAGKHVHLRSNINLSGRYWIPIGRNGVMGAFAGTFDGGGNLIDNMTVLIATNDSLAVGLFGYNAGTVKNVGIGPNCSVTGQGNRTFAGGVVGCNSGAKGTAAIVMNCYNLGTVYSNNQSSSTASWAGGIVGYNAGTVLGSYVRNCYNAGGISAITGNNIRPAGVVGYNHGNLGGPAVVMNCYNIGNITGTNPAAMIGWHFGTDGNMTHCYALNNITTFNNGGTADNLSACGTFANNSGVLTPRLGIL